MTVTSSDPLDAPAARADEFRRSGHDLIDRMADYLATVEARPVFPASPPSAIASRFAEPLPLEGLPAEEVWGDVWTRVVGDAIQLANAKSSFPGQDSSPGCSPPPHALGGCSDRPNDAVELLVVGHPGNRIVAIVGHDADEVDLHPLQRAVLVFPRDLL